MRSSRTQLLAVLVVLSSCKATPSPSASATRAPPPAVAASSRATERRPPVAADVARHAAFASAVASGRIATVLKHYDEAIHSFGDALVALPDSASALSERGYAELLADRLDEAERDLVTARGLAHDPALRGALSFNLGLVREKRHDTEGARAAFALSNDVHPTKLAQAKLATLGGSTSCTATDLRSALPTAPFTIANDWIAAHAIVRDDDEHAELADEAAARRATCVKAAGQSGPPAPSDVCNEPPPWTISTLYQGLHSHVFVIAPMSGKRLLVGDLGMRGGGPCSGGGDSSMSDVDTKLLGHVLVVDEVVTTYLWRPVGQTNDTDPVPPDAELDCRQGAKERQLTLIDLDTGHVVTLRSVDAESEPSIVQDAAKGELVKLRGGGCDEVYPFGRP